MSLDYVIKELDKYLHSDETRLSLDEYFTKCDIEEAKSERFKQRCLERIKRIDNLSKDSFVQFLSNKKEQRTALFRNFLSFL